MEGKTKSNIKIDWNPDLQDYLFLIFNEEWFTPCPDF